MIADLYTYILAPWTTPNWAILKQAVEQFPDLIDNRQIGGAWRRSPNDMVSDGELLVNGDDIRYIYVKANTEELMQSGLLAHISDYTLYTKETQPFEEYWLNVNL